MERDDLPRGEPDNWWWLAVKLADVTHLYELGYAVRDKDGVAVMLTDERRAEIMDELGNPDSFVMEMTTGRPNHLLEPKRIDEATGELGPIMAKPGVVLHLKGE